MEKFDKADLVKLGVLGFLLLALIGFGEMKNLKADSGWEGAVRKEEGSYSQTRTITISSNTGTAIFSSTVKRPDAFCFNNSASILWIGTTTAQANGYTHPNIQMGVPWLSSSTLRLDGSHTGEIDATADIGVTSINVRCADVLVQ